MNNVLQLNNYYKSLSQKYNAVCFDIDGTITDYGSKNISEKFIPFFAKLLKMRVPVVFITGRGESSKQDIEKIIPILKKNYNINDKMLNNIYIIANDGARLFKNIENNHFINSEYMVDEQEFEKISSINEEIIEYFKDSPLNKVCEISYSKDSTNDKILNIRVIIKTKEEQIIKNIKNIVDGIINSKNSETINTVIGNYNSDSVVQVDVAIKSEAVIKAEKILGIPENSMLRIGDCGDITGNDYSMLDCSQGFSVDKTSGKIDACFPVLDNSLNQVKGIDGTIYLLSKAKILPTICLEKAEETEYKKAFSMVEKKINFGRKEHLLKFNNIINDIFKEYDGIDSIFDQNTGAVKIKMYDWELIDNDNPLKKLYENKKGNSMLYALKDNDSFLLRGSSTYYYFLANRECKIIENREKEVDITKYNDVIEWFNNYNEFFYLANNAVIDTSNINEINNKKMILGVLDNIRNYLLVSINQLINNEYHDDNVLYNFENTNEKLIGVMYKLLLENNILMKNITFNKNFTLEIEIISDLLKNTNYILEEHKKGFEKLELKENYSKDFRAYREIDNFAENYITVKLSLDKLKDYDINNIGIAGLCYGGLELPILFKVIENKISDISVLKFNKKTNGYSKKQSFELRYFDINNNGGLILKGIDKNKLYILADDNLLTGKTMQLALNTMYDVGIDIDSLSIVRYPSVNRISQMFLPNHGAVNYRRFFDFINGLCFPSPYTYKDQFSQDLYEDSLGNFDLNRKKISNV